MFTKNLSDHVHVADDPEHRRTCVVCSTLGVRRTSYEFKVREFTPAGEIIELKIMQTMEPLEDRDIKWVLDHAALQIEPRAQARPVPVLDDDDQVVPKLIWGRVILLVLIVLLLVVLFQHLPL